MKIVDKLFEDLINERSILDLSYTETFKAGYQAAIDQLKEIVRDDKFYNHIATASDFSKYLDREVEVDRIP